MAWGAVFGTPELGGRVLAHVGPRVGLAAREAGRDIAQAWAPEVVAGLARTNAWEACVPAPASLHALLEPIARRAHSFKGSGEPTAVDAADGPGFFDAAFVLLARTPAAAEEPQQSRCPDEDMRRSPLIVAARCGLVGVAGLVARHCAPGGRGLNHQDAMGCSALRYAIVNKDIRMCSCLLRFPGLDMELPDSRGDTALLQAVGANAPAVCRLLLERGADPAHVNRGQTALDLAETLGYEGCAAVLREHGAPSGCGTAWSDAPGGDGSSLSESELDEGILVSRAWKRMREEEEHVLTEAADSELDQLDSGSEGAHVRRRRGGRHRWDIGDSHFYEQLRSSGSTF